MAEPSWWEEALTQHWSTGETTLETRRAAKTALAEIERLRAAAGGGEGGEEPRPWQSACIAVVLAELPETVRAAIPRTTLDKLALLVTPGGERGGKARQPEPPVSSTVRNGRMGF